MPTLNADGVHTFAMGVMFAILGGLAVVLRFVARTLVKAKYGWDDWWIVLALLVCYAYLTVIFWGKSNPRAKCDSVDSGAGSIKSQGGGDIGTPGFDPIQLTPYLEASESRELLGWT